MNRSEKKQKMRAKHGSVVLSIVAAIYSVTPSVALVPSDDDVSARCHALQSVDVSVVPDAPTQVTSTSAVDPSGDTVGYCQVNGYITPNINFVIRLPTTYWNGKFIEQGCGGFCGHTEWIEACRNPLRRGYACIASDMGHRSTDAQALWAYNNLQAQIDHAYRSAHVAALAGKAIVERYYKKKPSASYFTGCSTGGRQALMEAQRFPEDFDGIIAGSPSLAITMHHMTLLWANRALTDSGGNPLLDSEMLELLHQAVLSRCDLDDGVRDGVIEDPQRCAFDPAELRCTTGKKAPCLTAEQLEAVNKVYRGPTTSSGEGIFLLGRALKGSERTWLGSFVHWAGDPNGMRNFVAEQFRYIAFDPAPGPGWQPESFDFDRDYKRLGAAQGMFDAVNPDLRRFEAAGGKLLVYTALNDAVGLALPPIDYYETVERTMGGRAATQKFFRLFAIPGMDHCTGGDGAFAIDYLTYLENWVEKGKAPDVMIGAHVPSHKDNYRGFSLEFPLDPAIPVGFTRPVYPYPLQARYRGAGNPDVAENFAPQSPRHDSSK